MFKKVIIVGGHGNVALRLARLLSSTHTVSSVIRSSEHSTDITSAGATPVVLSLEHAPVAEFTALFEGAHVVYFSAGAGGKGGADRTKAVDYEGALKVFDAIESLQGQKPRLILVSAVDIRDPDKIPEHYNESDLDRSKKIRETIGTYIHWKYEADKNLVQRTSFKWIIVRPGGLLNTPGTGKADIGITHLAQQISRDDVAKMLALLADREDAAGLALDIVGGDVSIEEGLDAAIKKGLTAWIG